MKSESTLQVVITTIQAPTPAVLAWQRQLAIVGGRLVVAGDQKGPAAFDLPECDFLSLAGQRASGFTLAELLPTGHYSRKNIGYLHAIRTGAECVYETDDDNAPLAHWRPRHSVVRAARVVPPAESACPGWVNVYRFFSVERQIWPRGFPLEHLADMVPACERSIGDLFAPVQQGLVNGSPDVDAVWRLTQDRPFEFSPAAPVVLGPGQWCPFNTQSTWWWPVAFPLLYIPSFCSFRMCDIWKSLVAQRCLWALGAGIAFHAPEVLQDRNPHDYLRDFKDEVPGYLQNAKIAEYLSRLVLAPGPARVAENMRACYAELVEQRVYPAAEMTLLDAWLADLRGMGKA